MNIHSRFVALAAAVSILGAAPVFAQEPAAHVKPATDYVQKNI